MMAVAEPLPAPDGTEAVPLFHRSAARFSIATPRRHRSVFLSMLNTERSPISGKRVQLMATCLCDAFYDDVAAATVEVLEHLGVEVVFPEAQTCCGQPAFNGGDWVASL